MAFRPLTAMFMAAALAVGCAPTCEPAGGKPYCLDDVLRSCAGEPGEKGVVEETDCAAAGEVCAFNSEIDGTPAAGCRPATCGEGWVCFAENEGERMCDAAGRSVFVCRDEGDGCYGWEPVEDCTTLGEGLSCVETTAPKDASCQ